MRRFAKSTCLFLGLCLILSGQPEPPNRTPDALMAKAATSFYANQHMARNWTWSVREAKSVAGDDGTLLQRFPAAVLQSFVRPDGTRCEAVTTWEDGLAAQPAFADPLTRCEGQAEIEFDPAALLYGRGARLEQDSSEGVVLFVPPAAALAQSMAKQIRCAASVEARITLDPLSYFPRVIEGRVVTGGCDGAEPARVHFGETRNEGLVYSTFHRGSRFRLEYELQRDRFGNGERGFWMLKRSRYENRSSWRRGESCIYWGREVPYRSRKQGQWLITESEVLASQFGATSKIAY